MSKKILIIGGTGLIGKTIYEMLSSRSPSLKIFIATRNKDGNPDHIYIDVNDKSTFVSLNIHSISLIIICTKDYHNNILDYAIKSKIDYIDITKPTSELIKSLDFTRKRSFESKIVFGSGWMGGIAPLLINAKKVVIKDITSVAIFIYYSTKDKAGKSSADFMAENVSKTFNFYQNNIKIITKHFLNSKYHKFDFDGKNRKVYDFDIPDLYIFNQIEKIPTVTAKLTFDSKFITSALGIMQKINLFKILNFKEKKLIFGGSGSGDISSFEISFSKSNLNTEKVTIKCREGQAALTAFSTVLHIEKMLKNDIKSGVYFSHQLHDPTEFISSLTSNNAININI
ncbi:saccharopine dehydrogenase [Flavobacterium sp. I-SCBP12n]|uniref:Saccharopine dehydrogenase n=1 Tax=Flavobacterium pygoscelis TaxID=2893176 RepID=A0A9X1Y107_9FLAO|nr:saccharopine dehydrogenase [Flavobacterium pygoscelis]MCK8143307.1 saccharopine dehydrogenase [Flavobacterium pygoscelis]